MLRSFIALSASSALAFLAVVQAQAFCGEKITGNAESIQTRTLCTS